MTPIGQPLVLQNTEDHGWIVSWQGACAVTNADGQAIESVSLTVALPRKASLTIEELQTFALMRAAELLQKAIDERRRIVGSHRS